MKAIITPRKGLSVAEYWYVPFAGQKIEILDEPLNEWYGIKSKPLCDVQNVDPFIHKDDLTFETHAPTQT